MRLDSKANQVRRSNPASKDRADSTSCIHLLTVFSWKSTLSSTILKSSRLALPGLHADYAFSLLIYAYALYNLAWSMVEGLGQYEQERAISEETRKSKDK